MQDERARLFLAGLILFLLLYCGGSIVRAAEEASSRVNAADYPTLQAAVDALPGRTGEVYLPPGKYVLEETLNLSYGPGGYKGGIKLRGAGRRTKIIARTSGKPAIDLTGANHCVMQDLNIEAEPNAVKKGNAPNVGLLLARNPDGGAAQEHRFTNVSILGAYTLANVYNITSELDRFIGCIFINKAPGSHNFVWASDNFAEIKSPYQGEIKTLYSNTELRIIGCSFYNWGGGEGGTNIYMRGFTMDTTVRDSYMNPPEGGHAVRLGMSAKGGPVRSTIFEGIRIEGSNADGIFRVTGRAENLTIRNSSMFYGQGEAVDADRLVNFVFEGNDVWNTEGWKTAMRAKELLNGRIHRNMFTFHNWGGENPQEGDPRVLIGQKSVGSNIQVAERSQVEIENLENTTIDALADDGVRRRYLGEAASGVVLNLAPVDTSAMENMKEGDLALDDGTNTESGDPALAVYDGEKWHYMQNANPNEE